MSGITNRRHMSRYQRIPVVALLIFLAGCASSPQTTGAIEWRGIYEKSQVNTASSAGSGRPNHTVDVIKSTDLIPATLGTKFGILYWVQAEGRDAGRKIVWKLPRAGLHDPKTN